MAQATGRRRAGDRGRLAVTVTVAGATVGATVLAAYATGRVRNSKRAGDLPVGSTRRAARNVRLAVLGGRVAATSARVRSQAVFASAARREELRTELQLRTASEVAAALGNMKGAFMKLGQMASYLDDGLPEPVREALSQLQSDAPPMSPRLAASVIEAELGAPPAALFERWDPVPIAAASIGQVHRAITADGRAVAVKVQYPGVDEAIAADLSNAGWLFGAIALAFPSFDPDPLVAELKRRIVEELDYRSEAANQQLFADFYAGHPFISVPAVVPELSTGRVLATELAAGARFTDVERWSQLQRDLAGETLFRFVFRSLYRLGAFNGDPHPGNYLFAPDGRITFLDFGLVKRFQPGEIGTFQSLIETMVLHHDPDAFRGVVERAGLLVRDAPVTTEQVIDYFGGFYADVRSDGVFRWTPDKAAAAVRRTFDTSHPVTRYANVPAAFVLIQRINLGLFALLGRLGCARNWRQIADELWPAVDGPPSTPLGELEADWWRRRIDRDAPSQEKRATTNGDISQRERFR